MIYIVNMQIATQKRDIELEEMLNNLENYINNKYPNNEEFEFWIYRNKEELEYYNDKEEKC